MRLRSFLASSTPYCHHSQDKSLLVRRHKTERAVGESVEHAWSGGEAAWGLHASIEGEAPSDLKIKIDSHQYPY
jgi:phosphoenolpyruvate synthase/pyruvate phosphate dikinase